MVEVGPKTWRKAFRNNAPFAKAHYPEVGLGAFHALSANASPKGERRRGWRLRHRRNLSHGMLCFYKPIAQALYACEGLGIKTTGRGLIVAPLISSRQERALI
jgi:hypothetical protein